MTSEAMTPKVDPAEINLRIRELINLRGGVAEVARTSGIAKPTLETYMQGKSLPGSLALAGLSVGLQTSVDWLLFGRSAAQRAMAGEVRQ